MPKDKIGYSHSSNRSRTSPYPCSSGHDAHPLSKKSLDSVQDVKEWDEARCPVCMEHPHNAVLLLCSSHGKGCHPFMCDTSQRHSNCLDQFRKAFAETPTQDGTLQSSMEPTSSAEVLPGQIHPPDNKTQMNLVCPLCRGQVNGWTVVNPARRFMNAKSRNCACETCDFRGTYSDLRKHARVEHPRVRPSEADPQRQRDWNRMEQETDMRDFFSAIESTFTENPQAIESTFVEDTDGDARRTSVNLYFIFRVYQHPTSESETRSRSRSSGHMRRQRRTSLVTPRVEGLSETDLDALEADLFEIPSDLGYSPSRSQLPAFEPGASSWFRSGNRASPPLVMEEDLDTENAAEDEVATNTRYSLISQSESRASIWDRSAYTTRLHFRRSRRPVTPEDFDAETAANSFEVATSPGRRFHVPTSESGGAYISGVRSRRNRPSWLPVTLDNIDIESDDSFEVETSPVHQQNHGTHVRRNRTSRLPVTPEHIVDIEDDSFEVATSPGYSPIHRGRSRVPTYEHGASSWHTSSYTSTRAHLRRNRSSRLPGTPESIDIDAVLNGLDDDSLEDATSQPIQRRRRSQP